MAAVSSQPSCGGSLRVMRVMRVGGEFGRDLYACAPVAASFSLQAKEQLAVTFCAPHTHSEAGGAGGG